MPAKNSVDLIEAKDFNAQENFYDKVLSSNLHPLIQFFLNLTKDQIVARYCSFNPQVSEVSLKKWLSYNTKYFKWAGADLMHVTSSRGKRKMVLIEVNSCPSGQKSMPFLPIESASDRYKKFIKNTFLPYIEEAKNIGVLFDKNPMENEGYAKAISSLTSQPVYLIPCFEDGWQKNIRTNNSEQKIEILYNKDWIGLDAIFKYVTQSPWKRIPFNSKTKIFNPIVACLAGGRNKLVAARAYEIFNAELKQDNLKIDVPKTVLEVNKNEIPLVMKSLGGKAVIKVPYANAGQGVFTIINEQELEKFLKIDFSYEKFIVQELIGSSHWSLLAANDELYHVGTVPDKNGDKFVYDLRFMVANNSGGFMPNALYARRARESLSTPYDKISNSWDVLGTNLSKKISKNEWDTDIERLIVMDSNDFEMLGLGIDRIIESYVQTCLATIAIDKMATHLVKENGSLNLDLYRSMNGDRQLMSEIEFLNL